jgi:hypothetical protein
MHGIWHLGLIKSQDQFAETKNYYITMNLCRQVSNLGEIVSFPLLFYSASNLLGATAHGMMVEQKQFSETVTNKGWIRSTTYD